VAGATKTIVCSLWRITLRDDDVGAAPAALEQDDACREPQTQHGAETATALTALDRSVGDLDLKDFPGQDWGSETDFAS
jgi:hypothetical protein